MIKCENKLICSKEVFCHSAISKSIGLMFHKKLVDCCYIFVFDSEKSPFEISIHNLFVFFSTDVLYLNKDKKIVDMKNNFKPFSLLFVPKKKAKFILEFTSGIINKYNLKIGDKIDF